MAKDRRRQIQIEITFDELRGVSVRDGMSKSTLLRYNLHMQ